MFDQQSQAAKSYVMRSEPLPIGATRARRSVTGTNRTRLADRAIVFFDFAYSRGDRQFDRNG